MQSIERAPLQFAPLRLAPVLSKIRIGENDPHFKWGTVL